MNRYNSSFLALALGLVTIFGAAGVAGARWGGPHHGGGYGCGAMQAPSPEARKLMESSYNTIAPLAMQLRAKQDELTAKIYNGADAKTIEALSKDVNQLQTQLANARLDMTQQFAKAGVPLHYAGRGCPFMGGGMYGGGMYGGGYAGTAPDQQ